MSLLETGFLDGESIPEAEWTNVYSMVNDPECGFAEWEWTGAGFDDEEELNISYQRYVKGSRCIVVIYGEDADEENDPDYATDEWFEDHIIGMREQTMEAER